MKFLVLLGQEDSPGGVVSQSTNLYTGTHTTLIHTYIHTHYTHSHYTHILHTYMHTLHTYLYTHYIHTYTERESKGEREEGSGCSSLDACLSGKHKALSSSPTPYKLVWWARL